MSVADSAKVHTLHGSFSNGKELGFRNGRFLRENKGVMLTYISSWFNDKGVQMAVPEWCAGAGERKFSRNFHLCT